MELLLITGAGASHNLAVGDQKMPLMTGWSEALAAELNGRQAGLAEACGLTTAANGPLFEANLGRLLQYARLAPLNDAFINLSGPHPGSYNETRETTCVRSWNAYESSKRRSTSRFTGLSG